MGTKRRRRGAALATALLVLATLVGLGSLQLPPAGADPHVTPLFNFGLDASQGKGQVSDLAVDEHGVLYGVTYEGGAHGYGTVFSVSPPTAGSSGWTHTVLHSFCASSACLDGSYPLGGLTFATQPNGRVALFGTTNEGGQYGYGTIFRLSPPTSAGGAWTHTVLHSFEGDAEGNHDGAYPMGRLAVGTGGHLALYGTTSEGGTGNGTVYRLSPPDAESPTAWTETVVHRFDGTDGADPRSGPVAHDGRLYGTTYEGGAHGVGAIYQLTPPSGGGADWSETVIHDFVGADDGANPIAGLLVGDGGTLSGTTAYGGGAGCSNQDQCGTVFQLHPPATGDTTWSFQHLWSFGAGSQTGDPLPPSYPVGDLAWGPDGALYGTTTFGGYFGDGSHAWGACSFVDTCGTVFRMGTTMEVVHRFCDPSGCVAGAEPAAGLILHDGRFYGTTSWAGEGEACSCGAVFTLDAATDLALPPDPSTAPDDDLAHATGADPAAATAPTLIPRFTG